MEFFFKGKISTYKIHIKYKYKFEFNLFRLSLSSKTSIYIIDTQYHESEQGGLCVSTELGGQLCLLALVRSETFQSGNLDCLCSNIRCLLRLFAGFFLYFIAFFYSTSTGFDQNIRQKVQSFVFNFLC